MSCLLSSLTHIERLPSEWRGDLIPGDWIVGEGFEVLEWFAPVAIEPESNE